MATDTKARLKGRYREEIVPGLQSEFGYPNIMQVPTVTKVVVNMGVGEAARDSKLIEGAIRDLTEITGQKPQITKARKSIAQFKLREGQPIGADVFEQFGHDLTIGSLTPPPNDPSIDPDRWSNIAVAVEQLRLVRPEIPASLLPAHGCRIE